METMKSMILANQMARQHIFSLNYGIINGMKGLIKFIIYYYYLINYEMRSGILNKLKKSRKFHLFKCMRKWHVA